MHNIIKFPELADDAIISEQGLAEIFGKCRMSIKRAVKRGELPEPFRIFGKNAWRAGSLRAFFAKLSGVPVKDERRAQKQETPSAPPHPPTATAANVIQKRGVLIDAIERGSAMDRAGLREGDLIERISGRVPNSLDAAHKILSQVDKAVFVIVRDGKRLTLSRKN